MTAFTRGVLGRKASIVFALGCASLVAPAAAQAAFPGANGKIAFERVARVWTMQPDGTGQTQLTNVQDIGPEWSPDGQKIVYLLDRSPCQGGDPVRCEDIITMNADGSGATNLTMTGEGPSDFESPGWSPDGGKIIFTRYPPDGSSPSIWTMNADGTGQQPVTSSEGEPDGADWSPDGSKIAYSRFVGTMVEVFVMDLAGGSPLQLTSASSSFAPEWSPDGKKIAFHSLRDGNLEIYVMNADGSNQTRLTTNAAADAGPTWSPDGTKIVFASRRDGNGEIYVMNADGSNQTRVTSTTQSEASPDWQPLGAFDPYPRPGGGTPLRVPLVTAFEACTNPNATHTAPLALPSCTAPSQQSTELTTSTTGKASNLARFDVFCNGGAPNETPPCNVTVGDQEDLRITVFANDVRRKSDDSDYSGKTLLSFTVRITDKSHGFGDVIGTTQDALLEVPADCVATPTSPFGGTCSLSTTADTLLPGFAKERKRMVISAHEVSLQDAGPDGSIGPAAGCPPTCGTGDEQRYLVQGVFLP
jgi:hypothetical protein